MISAPIVKDIVLLGGGHSHALLIHRWAMDPLPGVRLILVSQDVLTPYSGMLPGYIAGHYSSDEIHIDLCRLCRWAGIRFIVATATGLDPSARVLQLDGRPSIYYDALSIDIGSTPDLQTVPGAAANCVPVKPIYQFQSRWLSLLTRLSEQDGQREVHVGVVGSGVGGFELLLAMHHGLMSHRESVHFHWIIRGEEPIKNRPPKARTQAVEACIQRGITLHTRFDVAEVQGDRLLSTTGTELLLDEVIWCTAASAAQWIASTQLATDERGFIATNAYLQSTSHKTVFGTGDCATQIDTPSEKAGVFAVRQAPVLFENLRAFVQNQPLKKYVPQKYILNLMALGERSAIATRGRLAVKGDWVWKWKDQIDRRFMNKLKNLHPMEMAFQTVHDVPDALLSGSVVTKTESARCGGCGAKVPAQILDDVLANVTTKNQSSVLVGLSDRSDGAVIHVDTPLAQSVDQFRAMIDDPWLFARITVLHALSDLAAINAKPHSAMMLVGMPFADTEIHRRELSQIVSGAIEELDRHDCSLLGGHTSEMNELTLGFSVNGLMANESSQVRLRDGDRLVLTKPLGTGVILAANMQGLVNGRDYELCIASMLQSNSETRTLINDYSISACTDITGFGFAGHLLRLLDDAQLGAVLDLSGFKFLPGAIELATDGISSTLLPANREFLNRLDVDSSAVFNPELMLMADPQTNGGLLFGISGDHHEECLLRLSQAGIDASLVGYCRSGEPGVKLQGSSGHE